MEYLLVSKNFVYESWVCFSVSSTAKQEENQDKDRQISRSVTSIEGLP